MNTPNENPSHHTTRQEIEKAPQTRCLLCGLVGVREMVRGGECLNVLACARRQRDNAKRKPEKPVETGSAAPPTPKKAKAGK